MSACDQHKLCIQKALYAGERICEQQDLRFTPIRRRVLEIIWESHKPAKAYDILDKLDDASKPPTVYRALEFLQENGLVHRINSLNAYVGCSHPDRHHQCYFLICTGCENVFECCNASLSRAIEKTAKNNHFSSTCSSVEIQGLCEQCKDRAST